MIEWFPALPGGGCWGSGGGSGRRRTGRVTVEPAEGHAARGQVDGRDLVQEPYLYTLLTVLFGGT